MPQCGVGAARVDMARISPALSCARSASVQGVAERDNLAARPSSRSAHSRTDQCVIVGRSESLLGASAATDELMAVLLKFPVI
jgi:hypothetical protein